MDMVRSSIDQKGGHIDIVSEINNGTTFSISIPYPRSILIITSLLVQVANNKYIIPSEDVLDVSILEGATQELSNILFRVGELAEQAANGVYSDAQREELGQPDLVIRHRVVTSAGRFPALMHGETDLHCGPASATLRRRETLDFSILYFVDGAALAARPGGYETVFETGRGDFGVLEGTTTVAIAEDLRTRNDIEGELRKFPSHRRGLAALAKGEIDMYVGDQSILLFQIEALGLADEIAVREDILSFEPYALVMRRGEDRLRLAVDRALSSLYDDGSIYQMIRQELGDYPLSPEARAVYQIVGLPQ